MSFAVFLTWLIATVIVTVGVVATISFFAYRARSGGIWDQARSAAFALRYDNALRWGGIGGRERTRLVAELRANLVDAAGDMNMADALHQLGTPRTLARAIAGDQLRPRWTFGAAVGLGSWVILMFLLVVATTSWTSAVDATGTAGATGHLPLLPGVHIAYQHTAVGKDISVSGAWWIVLCPFLLAIVAARPWRLLFRASRGAPQTG